MMSSLFPSFEQFVLDNDLLSKAKGSLAVKLPRIMGQGKTKAEGLNLPPAPIERRSELISLIRSDEMELPSSVRAEIENIKAGLEKEYARLKSSEGTRDLAIQVLRRLSCEAGQKDNYYYAGRLVLLPVNKGTTWSWSITPYYPIISKIPPDVDYIEKGFKAAEELLDRLIMPPDVFENRLYLAWKMARHFSESDDVLIIEVARMFKIACQEERFWNAPKKQFFIDVPEAAFIANLLNWRRHSEPTKASFEFVRATLHQAHGQNAKVFYMPQNPEGTQITPVIYLRKNP